MVTLAGPVMGQYASGIAEVRRQAYQFGETKEPIQIPEEGIVVRILDEPGAGEWFGYACYYDDSFGYGGRVLPLLQDGLGSRLTPIQFRYAVNAYDVADERMIVLDVPLSLAADLMNFAGRKGTLMDRDFTLTKIRTGFDITYTAVRHGKKRSADLDVVALRSQREEIDRFLMNMVLDSIYQTVCRASPEEIVVKRRLTPCDYEDQAALADRYDDIDAISFLLGAAYQLDIDPNEYETWVDLAQVLTSHSNMYDGGVPHRVYLHQHLTPEREAEFRNYFEEAQEAIDNGYPPLPPSPLLEE